MVNIIAPLDYERWAALVGPLMAPAAHHVEVKPPPKITEQLGPVNAALSGTSSRAGEGMREPVSRSTEFLLETQERDPEHPLNGPHPTDLNWLFRLPAGVRDSMQGRPAFDPLTVMERYDHPENTRGATVSVLG